MANGSRDYHTKSGRERQTLYDMGMIQMDYLQSRNRLTDTENKHIVTKKEMGEG